MLCQIECALSGRLGGRVERAEGPCSYIYLQDTIIYTYIYSEQSLPAELPNWEAEWHMLLSKPAISVTEIATGAAVCLMYPHFIFPASHEFATDVG